MEKDQYLNIGSLSVAKNLYNFVNNELLSGTGINANRFWINFDKAVNEISN
jgi:Malate synthase